VKVLEHTKEEADRRSRLAYTAWVEANGRVGVNVARAWDELLDDEKYTWRLVYDACSEG